jgi:hypothetical protein
MKKPKCGMPSIGRSSKVDRTIPPKRDSRPINRACLDKSEGFYNVDKKGRPARKSARPKDTALLAGSNPIP